MAASTKRNLAPGLTIAQSPIHGNGCFAAVRFARRKKIAEYTGEKITNAEAQRRAHRRVLRISGLDGRYSIDGSVGGNGTHYINHSCRPNCFLQTVHGRLLVLALRDIRAGEEITLDYVDSMHSDQKRCTCVASDCRGTINKRRTRATSRR
jgi:SET domain-containing protein